MATVYNPLEDRFVVFNAVETPKVELKMPLFDEPLDMRPMGVTEVTDNGNIVMGNNLEDKMIHDNPTPSEQSYGTSKYTYADSDLDAKYKAFMESPEQDMNFFDTEEEIQNNANNKVYTQNASVKGSSKQAMDYFYKKLMEKNKGKKNAESLSRVQAAGIVGNLIHESAGLQTGIKGDGGRAFGLAQWHPDRQVGLKALAKRKGTKITDFNTQLEYVWHELNNTEKKALNLLLRSNTVKGATAAFMQFERPGDPQFSNRLKHAKSLLSS